MTYAELKEIADAGSISLRPTGTPDIQSVHWTINGLPFSGQCSIDLIGIYGVGIPDDHEQLTDWMNQFKSRSQAPTQEVKP